VPGLGRFYNGMLHPVLAPAALIALLALGLVIGQRGLAASRGPVLVLALGLVLGLVAGSQWAGAPINTDIALLTLGLACAGCALAAWRMPAALLLALAGALGLAAGWGLADMAVLGDAGARWVVIAGTWLGAALLCMSVAALSELARQPWQHIAVRVVASWMAASALLVLGLQWAGPVSRAA
jgi:hypothetical protein